MTVETATITYGEDRPGAAFADGQVDGAGGARRQGDRDGLTALAQHRQGPMPPLHPEGLDVRADRFGHP